MEKVHNLKRSNTAPSSKTFRDELKWQCLVYELIETEQKWLPYWLVSTWMNGDN
jgi:hypothetical protein